MSTTLDLEHSVQTLQNDLVGASTGDGTRIASYGQTWRALSLWMLFTAARTPPTWLLVAGVALLSVLIPAVAWIALVVVVGYLPVMASVSAYITFSGSWNLLIDEQRTAVIGFRIWHHDGQVQLIIDSHVARRLGAGHGKRLRGRLAGPLAGVMAKHPATIIRFRAQNARLAAVYRDELKAVLPETAGWNHHLNRVNGTVRRQKSEPVL